MDADRSEQITHVLHILHRARDVPDGCGDVGSQGSQLVLVDGSTLVREAQARATCERLDLIMEGYIQRANCGVYESPGERRVFISQRLKQRSEGCNADARSDYHHRLRAFEEEMAARSGDPYGNPASESKEGRLNSLSVRCTAKSR